MDVFPEYVTELIQDSDIIDKLRPVGGMEMRDFFAGQALSGLLARGETADLAQKAYGIADRMIEEARKTH